MMDALDQFLLSQGQSIRVVARVVPGTTQRVDVYFGSEPSKALLEPVERLLQAGGTLITYSTSRYKGIELVRTIYSPVDVADALAATWRAQGYQVSREDEVAAG